MLNNDQQTASTASQDIRHDDCHRHLHHHHQLPVTDEPNDSLRPNSTPSTRGITQPFPSRSQLLSPRLQTLDELESRGHDANHIAPQNESRTPFLQTSGCAAVASHTGGTAFHPTASHSQRAKPKSAAHHQESQTSMGSAPRRCYAVSRCGPTDVAAGQRVEKTATSIASEGNVCLYSCYDSSHAQAAKDLIGRAPLHFCGPSGHPPTPQSTSAKAGDHTMPASRLGGGRAAHHSFSLTKTTNEVNAASKGSNTFDASSPDASTHPSSYASGSSTPRPIPGSDVARAARRQRVNETSSRLRKKHEVAKHPITYHLSTSACPRDLAQLLQDGTRKRQRSGFLTLGEHGETASSSVTVNLPSSPDAQTAHVIGGDTDAMLIVKGAGETLMQRLSAPNYKKGLQFTRLVGRANELLAALRARAREGVVEGKGEGQEEDIDGGDDDGDDDGVSMNLGLDGHGWTSGPVGDEMLEWAWRLFHQHVHPLATLLQTELRASLDAREATHDSFRRLLGAGQCPFTHPWWLRATITYGFPATPASAPTPALWPSIIVACEEPFILCAQASKDSSDGYFKTMVNAGQVVFIATPYHILPANAAEKVKLNSATAASRWGVTFAFPHDVAASVSSSSTLLRRRLNPPPLQPDIEEQRRYKLYPRFARLPKEPPSKPTPPS